MSYLWRIKVDRPNSANDTYLFTPPNRMYLSHLFYGNRVFQNPQCSFQLDAPSPQITDNQNSPIRIRFDRPMLIKNIYVQGKAGSFTFKVYNEDWSEVDFTQTNIAPYAATDDTVNTETLASAVWAQNVEMDPSAAFASTRFAFGVLNYAPSTLLINNTHELNFDELSYEALVPTQSKNLVFQMFSGRGPPTTVTATLVSS